MTLNDLEMTLTIRKPCSGTAMLLFSPELNSRQKIMWFKKKDHQNRSISNDFIKDLYLTFDDPGINIVVYGEKGDNYFRHPNMTIFCKCPLIKRYIGLLFIA